MEPTVITIITERLPEAVKALKKLAAKAERYGTPKVTWTVAPPRLEKRRTERDNRPVNVQVSDITLNELEAPRVGAFRFLARLERTPDGTIIDSIPGETLPERFRQSTGECEHCGKVRDRKHLFVVAKDGEEPLQVGRSCLRDFMGTDTPESVASRFRWERELRDFNDEWAGGGKVVDSAAELLAVTAAAIRLWGWVPKSAPESAGTATANRISVWFYLPPGNKQAKEDLDALKAALCDADWEEAEATMAWVAADDSPTEYMHNLAMILAPGSVEPKRRGYACSAVAAHQRALGLLELKRREREAAADSKHVGVVGERLRGLELTVLSNRGIPSQFGDCILYKMRDAAGNMFSWFKSGDGIMDVGNTYILDATVKAHTSYQGVLETQLTRAKKPGV